ncbi:hypothetical protein HRG84_01840 [Flavisolibacter sp. BT320]|nr:hypothetical protein [Flavisolibacter longurius]
MSIAEKKMRVMELLVNANDEITGELMEFAERLTSNEYVFSEDDVKKFEARLKAFEESGEKGLTAEESLAQLKALLK